ncbi:hypothetical protein PPL_08074 [Heterostelium album PN500]|uniref:BLOC-1-related complex subunit 6 C-terminal helix domain-containing protein n=1 Tax=Heterostelium pallidum (strain ATCC 26659 / Pp 5 / PN500) TaxID=670386 RepID=D3BIJ5_HETP5|nr:hypothetical protein PPL_08074 [Heterostelium album PN500]EFA78619.1 hypothetical protein PPL_08074 [Heterostelium album PN500]|eukprot:XP_020430743.1 hypothetical protein PPL_08074 [Heterostelium album PN500]
MKCCFLFSDLNGHSIGNHSHSHHSHHHHHRHAHRNDDSVDSDDSSGSEEILEMTDTDHSSARMSFISHMSTPSAASPLFQSPGLYSMSNSSASTTNDSLNSNINHMSHITLDDDIETMIASPTKHFPRHYYRHSIMDPVGRDNNHHQQQQQNTQTFSNHNNHSNSNANKYNTAVGYNESQQQKKKQYKDHYRNDFFGFVAPPSTPTSKTHGNSLVDDEYSSDSDDPDESENEKKYKYIKKQAAMQHNFNNNTTDTQNSSYNHNQSGSGSSKYNNNSNQQSSSRSNSNHSSTNNSRNNSLTNLRQPPTNVNSNNQMSGKMEFDYRKPEEFQQLLTRIKENSAHYGAQFNDLVNRTKVINHSMSHIMMENFENYSKTCTDVLDETYHSMESMKTLINSMELLNSDLFHVYKLASQIKHIKKSLDLLDIYVSRLPSID